MPTDAERNALVFLASLALLGAGVRTIESHRFARELTGDEGSVHPSTARTIGERALASQIAAVDSARAARATKGATKRSRAGNKSPTPAESEPARSRANSTSSTNDNSENYAPPEAHSGSSGSVPTIKKRKGITTEPLHVNINRATLAELDRLPRVGPALAARIISWRETHGPFRSIDDLRHVRGIGPTTAALLAPSVTF